MFYLTISFSIDNADFVVFPATEANACQYGLLLRDFPKKIRPDDIIITVDIRPIMKFVPDVLEADIVRQFPMITGSLKYARKDYSGQQCVLHETFANLRDLLTHCVNMQQIVDNFVIVDSVDNHDGKAIPLYCYEGFIVDNQTGEIHVDSSKTRKVYAIRNLNTSYSRQYGVIVQMPYGGKYLSAGGRTITASNQVRTLIDFVAINMESIFITNVRMTSDKKPSDGFLQVSISKVPVCKFRQMIRKKREEFVAPMWMDIVAFSDGYYKLADV